MRHDRLVSLHAFFIAAAVLCMTSCDEVKKCRKEKRWERAVRRGYVQPVPAGQKLLPVPCDIYGRVKSQRDAIQEHKACNKVAGQSSHWLACAIQSASQVRGRSTTRRAHRLNQRAARDRHDWFSDDEPSMDAAPSPRLICLEQLVDAPLCLFSLHSWAFNVMCGTSEEDESDLHREEVNDSSLLQYASCGRSLEVGGQSDGVIDSFGFLQSTSSGLATEVGGLPDGLKEIEIVVQAGADKVVHDDESTSLELSSLPFDFGGNGGIVHGQSKATDGGFAMDGHRWADVGSSDGSDVLDGDEFLHELAGDDFVSELEADGVIQIFLDSLKSSEAVASEVSGGLHVLPCSSDSIGALHVLSVHGAIPGALHGDVKALAEESAYHQFLDVTEGLVEGNPFHDVDGDEKALAEDSAYQKLHVSVEGSSLFGGVVHEVGVKDGLQNTGGGNLHVDSHWVLETGRWIKVGDDSPSALAEDSAFGAPVVEGLVPYSALAEDSAHEAPVVEELVTFFVPCEVVATNMSRTIARLQTRQLLDRCLVFAAAAARPPHTLMEEGAPVGDSARTLKEDSSRSQNAATATDWSLPAHGVLEIFDQVDVAASSSLSTMGACCSRDSPSASEQYQVEQQALVNVLVDVTADFGPNSIWDALHRDGVLEYPSAVLVGDVFTSVRQIVGKMSQEQVETRVAWDHQMYSNAEFLAWYGYAGDSCWHEADPRFLMTMLENLNVVCNAVEAQCFEFRQHSENLKTLNVKLGHTIQQMRLSEESGDNSDSNLHDSCFELGDFHDSVLHDICSAGLHGHGSRSVALPSASSALGVEGLQQILHDESLHDFSKSDDLHSCEAHHRFEGGWSEGTQCRMKRYCFKHEFQSVLTNGVTESVVSAAGFLSSLEAGPQ